MEPGQEPWIFFRPDLYEYPEGSLPSPYELLNPVRRLPPGLRLLAIGWLDGPIEFATGPTEPDVVSRLLALGDEYQIDEGTKGFHCCYYCGPDVFDRADESGAGGNRLLGWLRKRWRG